MPCDPSSRGPERFTNRELSWLEFNDRVLALAENSTLPLLERLKFCAIAAGNLDEFFMVRVAGLKEQIEAGVDIRPADGLSPSEQLAAVRERVSAFAQRLETVHLDELQPALAEHGIVIANYAELGAEDQAKFSPVFEQQIFGVLTPLAVDPSHPFPYISNLSLSLAVAIRDPESNHETFARVKVPSSLPRYVTIDHTIFVPIEQVISAHLGQLFPGMEVLGAWPFRITRNADLTLNDEDAEDLLEAIEMELRRRRFGAAVRLEVDESMPPETVALLSRELDLADADVYSVRGRLDCSSYWQLASLDRPDLKDPPFSPIPPPEMRDLVESADLFDRLKAADVLVHHPYDSFNDSVTEFIRLSAADPDVVAIKLTLYRTSGDSPIIQSLIDAVGRGKQVAALVELKARFDEENNIEWARRLEEAGVHVVYGILGLKIHTKTTLVVRQERDGLRRYCHVGTGNYNPKTARIYEDIGLLTANPDVGDDLTLLFNTLTGYGRASGFENLLVAPTTLRESIEQLIERETSFGSAGRIIAKMNSLVDPDLIDSLYEASQAGVQIDLIIRGICCLRPGLPGLSENIRVRSIVGRYLEHARIYYFANGGADDGPAYYIGSADLMPRNLDRRVEALVRIDPPPLQGRLAEILNVNLDDVELSWAGRPDGGYDPPRRGGLNAHNQLEELARERGAVSPVAELDRWAGRSWLSRMGRGRLVP